MLRMSPHPLTLFWPPIVDVRLGCTPSMLMRVPHEDDVETVVLGLRKGQCRGIKASLLNGKIEKDGMYIPKK